MNMQAVVKKRRKVNQVLSLVLLCLVCWIGALFYHEIRRVNQSQNQAEHVSRIVISRENSRIVLAAESNKADAANPTKTESRIDNATESTESEQMPAWYLEAPIEHLASSVVVETLLEHLLLRCEETTAPQAQGEFYADILLDEQTTPYRIGHLDSSRNKIVMNHGEKWYFCDQLLASIALAPAINFIDKRLYEGELQRIVGTFGQIEDVSGIDFSVLEIAPAEKDKALAHELAKLQFISDVGESQYSVLATDTNEHLLLYSPEKSLIYVIANHPKLQTIVGLD